METIPSIPEACWQGDVADVIAELTDWLKENDWNDDLPEDDPRSPVAKARRYLNNS